MRLIISVGAAVIATAASFVSLAEESQEITRLRQSQTELLFQIEQLRQETQALRGLMEELSFQLTQMSSDQKNRYLDLDQRLGELVRIQKESVEVQQSMVAARSVSEAPLASADGPSPIAAVSVAPKVSDKEAYNNAFQLIRERQFDESVVAMELFINTYPESPLVLDARFWRGQVFDVLGKDRQAIEAFKTLTIDAPEYRRILQVKVKLGKLLIKNQEVVNGRKILEEVIAEAPASVEAGLASRELDNVN